MDYKVQPPTVYESHEAFENAELEARRLALSIKGAGHPWLVDCDIELEDEAEESVVWQATISFSGQGDPEDLRSDLENRLEWLLAKIRQLP